jgi:hypothetical protein
MRVEKYPRFICVSTKACIAHQSLDCVEFLHHLYPNTSRRELALMLLMTKRMGLLRDEELQVGGGGKSSNKKGFRGRLERLHTRREKHFPQREFRLTDKTFSPRCSLEVAFPILFTEPQGKLCLKANIDHAPEIRSRDYWWKVSRLDRLSYVIPNYLKPEATNTKAENVIAREWLVIESAWKRAVFASDENDPSRIPKD